MPRGISGIGRNEDRAQIHVQIVYVVLTLTQILFAFIRRGAVHVLVGDDAALDETNDTGSRA